MITFTDTANQKVKELFEEENNPNIYLRVYIEGGGCAGMNYGFAFEEEKQEDDLVFEMNGWTLIVDAMSYQYLEGSEVDFKSSLMGSHFTLKNPHAKTTCGCGSSFAV